MLVALSAIYEFFLFKHPMLHGNSLDLHELDSLILRFDGIQSSRMINSRNTELMLVPDFLFLIKFNRF